MRRLFLLLALAATPAQAQVTDADARAFVARQEAAWNAGRLDSYFAGYTPDATFTDQAYVGDKPPVPYGTSTVAQAHAFARKAFAKKPWPSERGRLLRIEPVPGGAQVRVVSAVGSTVWDSGKPRRLCASRSQTLTSAGGKIRATSQTDTFVKCRGG
ncbi:MAG: hypothetical protein DI570_13780 [Phenylobacterium zucineum]|nr:MAG: hypothetical protein DI570_13780 [Phenylobacterium zucineum]